MELEGYKTAWQKRPVEDQALARTAHLSQSLSFFRTSVIRDLQRSDEVSRLVFSLLFALVAVGASLILMPQGTSRWAWWLFAALLLADGIGGVALRVRRWRQPVTETMVDFIRREHSQLAAHLRFERFSQWLTVGLAVLALLLAIFGPRPVDPRESAYDALGKMAILTAFLAVAWRRAKSRSKEACREIERYLKDLGQ
jgi:hypothetical protein